ncbi:MAG: hypothetical protein QOK27_2371 [Gemmatimonadales bacterium]|nr:hypothetical protein [Gemmatimonadales bacterium]
MTASATHGALQRLARPLQSRNWAGWAALGVGSVALLLGAAAWSVRLGWFSAPYWVLVAWALALAALSAVIYVGWGSHAGLSVKRLAGRLEDLGAWRRGTLTALLDGAASGTSVALLDLADRAHAADITRRGAAAVEPLARPVRLILLSGAISLLIGALAFTSAGPLRGAAAALWHPRRAWEATVAPVRLRASAGLVDRGQPAEFHLEALGRKVATLWLRLPGESWKARGVRLDSLGRAVVSTGPLESDLFARLTSGSRSSDTVTVRVRLPVFLGSLSVTARYPSYLGLENELLPTGGDTLLLPAGTRLDTRGEATAPLARAAWAVGEQVESLRVTATRFEGSFAPSRSGEYRLAMVTASGAALAGDSVRLPIRLIPDSAPSVEIPVPGADTLAPLSLKVPLIIDVRDDHGVARVALESRRISRLGLVDSARRESIPLPPERPDRAILSFTLDLNRRGLLPGDTVRYSATAIDNAPRGHTGRSREFLLRLPTMSEVRAAQRQATAALAGQLDSITDESKRVERQTDDLAQERPRSGQSGEKNSESLPFQEAQRAQAVAKSQEELVRQAEELSQSLEALQRSAEAAGIQDSAWQRQLTEIRDQLERALSPELREKLAALQEALKNLDAEQTKDALAQLAEAQKQLREALERSRDLFRRAALEGDLANLAQESRELAREQRQWNEQVASADSNRSTLTEQQLAARTDSLSAALDRLARDAAPQDSQPGLGSPARQAGKAADEMQEAAKSARRGQRGQARESGEAASRSLEPLGDELQRRRQEMQREWRRQVVEAMDQALSETSRLAERQLGIQEELRDGGQPSAATRSEQAAIEEGVQKLLEQMKQVGGRNALVSPQIAAALGAAQLQMQQAREAISSAAPNSREAAEQAGGAVDELNTAAHQLVRARGDVSGSQSGSGLEEALERMAQLAQQQGGLGRQGAGLLPMAGGGAVRAQLQRMAARQRALAQELERLRGQGDMAGAGQMAEEAKELARRLEAGRLDRSVVERQERLFRRMLDAGRTLQGREEDQKKERQSMTATDDSVHLPPALRARLQGDGERLRVPTWDELQQLSPEERRLVVDYFRRLSDSSTR